MTEKKSKFPFNLKIQAAIPEFPAERNKSVPLNCRKPVQIPSFKMTS